MQTNPAVEQNKNIKH